MTGKDNVETVVGVSGGCTPHHPHQHTSLYLTPHPSLRLAYHSSHLSPHPSPHPSLHHRLNLEKHLTQFPFWADKMEQLPVYFLGFHGTEDVKSVIEVTVTTSLVTVSQPLMTISLPHVIFMTFIIVFIGFSPRQCPMLHMCMTFVTSSLTTCSS